MHLLKKSCKGYIGVTQNLWCIYSGAIVSKNNLSCQNVTLVCNPKCLSAFFMFSGSVVYLVLGYFKGCYTRQSNSPCIVTLPSSGYGHRCNIAYNKSVAFPSPPPFYSNHSTFGTAVRIIVYKSSGLDKQCNLEMAIFCASLSVCSSVCL